MIIIIIKTLHAGALLQKLNRDTQKCAFKCSMVVVDGTLRDVYKCPITDVGKSSKRGRGYGMHVLLCNV